MQIGTYLFLPQNVTCFTSKPFQPISSPLQRETKLSSNIQALIIRELGITISLNACSTFLINQSLLTITNDFNIWLTMFTMFGVNSIASLPMLGNEKTKKLFLPIAGSRMLLSTAINGQKLMQINKAYEVSNEAYTKLHNQVEAFERGYKPPVSNDLLSIVACIAVGAIILKLFTFRGKKNDEIS